MIKTVIKRDGREVDFNINRIVNAIELAIKDTKQQGIDKELSVHIANDISKINKDKMTVEEIQDLVEDKLMDSRKDVAKEYIKYRNERTRARDKKSNLMKVIDNIGVETDRDNANVGNNFSSKLLRIASESNKWHNLGMMPKHLAKLHENGDLYYHDLDSYNLTINCLNIDTGDVLKRGFNTGYGTILPARRIESASELSCILLQSTQNDMFGGQAHVNFDNDLAPFVKMTRQELKKEYKEYFGDIENLDEIIEKKLEKTVHQSMQGIVYNLNTMHSRAGSQVPFSSLNLGLPTTKEAEMICRIFLEEYEKGLGKGEQPIFPNIIFRVKKGVNREPQDQYYHLYELACRVASKRMNPMFMNLDADFNKKYYDQGHIPATMGCRTCIMSNVNGEAGAESRGNIAPTTINLPRLGILAKGDIHKFFELLDNRLQLARESLIHRYEILKKLKVKDLPFVIGQHLMKGSENLTLDDSIEPVLKHGTWGMGFIGLAETLIALTGKHHGEDKKVYELGVKIISHIRNFCDEYREIDKMNWSCYASPAEGLSGKFIKHDKAKFGIIKGVTDKDYYTNSYHIPVYCKISIKDKIDLEAPFHKLCNGGHITYIEIDDYPTPQLIKTIIDYAYRNTNISYMGINFHMRYCKECGTKIEQQQVKCSKCGSTNIQGVSRVTGYLSLDERFGEGKVAERKDRLSHNDSKHINTYGTEVE